MELKDFVASTLIQIAEGIQIAQKAFALILTLLYSLSDVGEAEKERTR